MVQILLLDLVFSLDSVITAVGMISNYWIMATAVVAAIGVMLIFAGPIARFVQNHPTMKTLALAFLVLIGVLLVAEGAGCHLPRGSIYFAMAFSLGLKSSTCGPGTVGVSPITRPILHPLSHKAHVDPQIGHLNAPITLGNRLISPLRRRARENSFGRSAIASRMLMKHASESTVFSNIDCDMLVSGMLTDPQTGITIIKLSGEVLFSNDPAVTIFLGPEHDAKPISGKSLWSLLPDNWVKELSEFGSQVVRSREPAMVRTVWRGRQVLSWVTPLDADAPAAEARLLVISRFAHDMPGGEDAEPRFAVFESRYISLGDMDILSPRELEVLALVGQGLSIREIAAMLHRSEKTIQNHRDSIGAKLNLPNRVHVAAVARRAGLKQNDAEKTRL